MVFPINIESPNDWLEQIPSFLSSLQPDSIYLDSFEFQSYLANKLNNFYSQYPLKFNSIIKEILKTSTELAKYLLIKILLLTPDLWKNFKLDDEFQPILTELALTPDKIYAKNAATLSKNIIETVESQRFKAEKVSEDAGTFDEIEDKEISFGEEEEEAFDDLSLSKIIHESEAETFKREKASKSAPVLKEAQPPKPSPAFGAPSRKTSPTSPPVPSMERMESISKKESIKPDTISSKMSKGQTIHTHVHYYSRMNPRKTYPFTVTLSTLAIKLKRDKIHILTGEEESETRGDFELYDIKSDLIIEPLLSGCLVQPTFQFFSPKPENFPSELTFYITPLVEAGFRSTQLEGVLYIKDEKSNILLKLELEETRVVSNRLSQLVAIFGVLSGGAMPFLDTFIFGGDLQAQVITQLSENAQNLAPAITGSFTNVDWWNLLTSFQIILVGGTLLGALIYWWKRSRARIGPIATSQLQLNP